MAGDRRPLARPRRDGATGRRPGDRPAAELTATITGAVAEGDAGAEERAAAAEELWRVAGRARRRAPAGARSAPGVLAGMSGQLAEIHDAEAAAVTRLGAALGR